MNILYTISLTKRTFIESYVCCVNFDVSTSYLKDDIRVELVYKLKNKLTYLRIHHYVSKTYLIVFLHKQIETG